MSLPRFRPVAAGSPILAMARKAAEHRAAGHEVIDLTLGEPDFAPPDHVIAAAHEALDTRRMGYTPVNGIPPLRAAIREHFARERGLTFADDEIAVGCGAKQVIFNAFLASLEKGDEVVLPAPYWASYPDMVRACGAVPVVVPTALETGFRLDPDVLAAAITPKTRWVVINAPGNPSGAVYSASDLAALAEVIAGHPRILVLSDDIYAPIRFSDTPYASFAAVVPDLADRTLTIDGVSKAYAMTGWRVGWAGGPKDLVTAINAVQSQNATQTSSLSQIAAVAALTGPQDSLPVRAEIYRKRRDAALAVLAESPHLSTAAPDGAFYLFPRIAGRHGDETAMALLEATGVAVVPGSAFGGDDHLRLSFALDEASLVEGCRRIVDFLERA
ncbi:pyridoxal phosphate-dependent aminotransferase [Acuticoccus sediminis]|uniref:pyridoxal phosphate-dependent aminotransferase n=1 Tax=Acuticoccus sediminis TaxID=2184697 RepID=UPI001CFCE3F3|nr:pyridoxal phosphate-dependent aminotransferase [Acuticoccus sediminis]